MSGHDPNSDTLPRLLTFAPMIDSELSRLVLGYYGTDYREVDHLFGWVSILTLVHGGNGKIPLLYGDGMKLTAPRAIVEHLDPTQPAERRLLPVDDAERASVERDWETYNGKLAADVAVFCYYHMLPEREVMTKLFARSLSGFEAHIVPWVYPTLRWMFTRLLGLRQPRIDEALARIRQTFDETDRRVSDGRRFLVGDRMTLSDLSLASAAAPMLLPDHYSAPVPRFDEMPAALQEVVTELRAGPTFAFVSATYQRISDQAPSAG